MWGGVGGALCKSTMQPYKDAQTIIKILKIHIVTVANQIQNVNNLAQLDTTSVSCKILMMHVEHKDTIKITILITNSLIQKLV